MVVYYATFSAGLQLTWVDNKNLEGNYELWRKEDNEGEWELAIILPRNTRAYTDENLSPGNIYMYKIRVFVNYKNAYSAFSEVAQAYTINYEPPKNVNYNVMNDNKIKLTWGHGAYTRSGYTV